jgi:hypothetical protein
MTVAQLREAARDRRGREGGVKLSALKRKSDLVDFLVESEFAGGEERRVNGAVVMNPEPTDAPAAPRARRRGAAARAREDLEEDTSPRPPAVVRAPRAPPLPRLDHPSGEQPRSRAPSPKDAWIERVRSRYPRLPRAEAPELAALETGDGAVDDDDEDEDLADGAADARSDHPLLRSINRTSCDLDLVFVGTASCTPGTTRGVSCTALRWNGRRQAHATPPAAAPSSSTPSPPSYRNPRPRTFPGGTWLFDVGECTQVRFPFRSGRPPPRSLSFFVRFERRARDSTT